MTYYIRSGSITIFKQQKVSSRGISIVMDIKGIQPNVVSYNSLMHGLCNSDQQEEASALFNEMTSFNIMPDAVTFNILVDTLCKKGKIQRLKE